MTYERSRLPALGHEVPRDPEFPDVKVRKVLE